MSDSNWRDPFAEDDAGREREARRAERERRRREDSTRESLGERVKREIEEDPAPESHETVVQSAAESPEVPETAEHAAVAPLEEETGDHPPVPPAVAGGPPRPPGKPPSKGAIHRRRFAALIGLCLLIAAVAGAGVVLSRAGDDNPAPVTDAPKKQRKTFELVVPEGFDRKQVAELAKKEGLKGDYEAATASVKGFGLEKYGVPADASLEGFLFPATYELFKGEKVESLVKKQVEAFEANLAEVDTKAIEKSGFTVYEALIVASMVEREIAVPEERELAASVIYNRLDNGTPLGIDATIRFEDSNYSGQLVQSRLESDTPYNTRTNTGLTPGPIGNPGLASMQAAADPPETDFFFFVVKPGSCNEHTFVETQAEFDQAAAEYQAALEAEGGSPTEC